MSTQSLNVTTKPTANTKSFLVLNEEESTQTLLCTLNNFPKDTSFMLTWIYNETGILSQEKYLNTDLLGGLTTFKHTPTQSGTYTCEVGNREGTIQKQTMTFLMYKNVSSGKFYVNYISIFQVLVNLKFSCHFQKKYYRQK